MDRQGVRRHKGSGIDNDANRCAVEVAGAAYLLKLLQRVIAVSLRTAEIVKGLPESENKGPLGLLARMQSGLRFPFRRLNIRTKTVSVLRWPATSLARTGGP